MAWGDADHEQSQPPFGELPLDPLIRPMADAHLTRRLPDGPLLLWHHKLAAGRNLPLTAPTVDEPFQPATRSWLSVAKKFEMRLRNSLWPPNAQ
jgi:hypothetical protein